MCLQAACSESYIQLKEYIFTFGVLPKTKWDYPPGFYNRDVFTARYEMKF